MAKPCLSVPSSEPTCMQLVLLRDTTVWSVGSSSTLVTSYRSFVGYVLWVRCDDATSTTESELRERVGLEGDSSIEVRTTVLSGWRTATVPPGSIDEVGHKLLDVLNVWENQLPPEGRVFLVHEG